MLRKATAVEQKAIRQLIREVRINPVGLKWQRFVVALDDNGEVIGCGQVKPHNDGTRELASIAVKKARRNQGIATAIIEWLMTNYAAPFWLTCESHMVPFYEKFGFVEMKELSEMSPYFRRLARISRLLLRFSKADRYLAVMFWKGD